MTLKASKTSSSAKQIDFENNEGLLSYKGKRMKKDKNMYIQEFI